MNKSSEEEVPGTAQFAVKPNDTTTPETLSRNEEHDHICTKRTVHDLQLSAMANAYLGNRTPKNTERASRTGMKLFHDFIFSLINADESGQYQNFRQKAANHILSRDTEATEGEESLL